MQIFRLLNSWMENLCGAEHLRLTKLPGLTLFTRKKFASPPSLMTHNSSETFQLKLYALEKKKKKSKKKKTATEKQKSKQTNVQFFRFLRALMEVHPIPHVIFEATESRFIQILHLFSVSLKITPLYFF